MQQVVTFYTHGVRVSDTVNCPSRLKFSKGSGFSCSLQVGGGLYLEWAMFGCLHVSLHSRGNFHVSFDSIRDLRRIN